MKICIISDLHCKHQQEASSFSDTFLISNKPRIPASQHPIASLLIAINKDADIKSQILLCPGDLGDKADNQGISSSWNFLEEIKNNIGADLLLGIPGNHDIDSRRKYNTDPFSYIKTFHEGFPTKNVDSNNRFWECGYCIVIHEKCLILLINTVHNHRDADGAAQSCLMTGALEKIKGDLASIKSTSFDYKICLLHHHPIKHSNIHDFKDSDSFENGDDLIRELNLNSFNIIIHGHKHQPRIVEYNGIPIFATGSFSSFAHLQGTGLHTMFHVLELKKDSKMGTIKSWEYDLIEGWSQKLNKAFPPKIGFGSDLDISSAALRINELFETNGKNTMLYAEIVKTMPEIEFLIPEKLIQLGKRLAENYNISTSPQFPLQPNIITELIK